jgi:hypothetical protein
MFAAAVVAVLLHVASLAAITAYVLGVATKKNPPVGAEGTVLLRVVQPKRAIKHCFPNTYQSSVREKCKMIGIGTRSVNGKHIVCYIINIDSVHTESGPTELWVSKKYSSAGTLSAEQKKMPSANCDGVLLLDGEAAEAIQLNPQWPPESPDATASVAIDLGGPTDLEAGVQNAVLLEEAYADDGKPLPENIEGSGMGRQDLPRWSDGYGHPGTCAREMMYATREKFEGRLTGRDPTTVADAFLRFSPVQYWRDVVVPACNERDPSLNLTCAEFVGFIAIRLLMATAKVSNARSWFKTTQKPCINTGVPVHLNTLMTGKRFFRISAALSFSKGSDASSATVNRFREQTPMEDAWNLNMKENYSPSELNVLDESVMFWLTQRTCPGWMCLPRKPWKFGGEWHTVSDKPNCVIFRAENSQGKDRPVGITKDYESEHGKGICSMILRLCEPLFGTGRTVHLDSGFCVLAVISTLAMYGLFGNAQIKKRRWAPSIPHARTTR